MEPLISTTINDNFSRLIHLFGHYRLEGFNIQILQKIYKDFIIFWTNFNHGFSGIESKAKKAS